MVGSAALLLPRPSVSIGERARMIGMWDVLVPVIVVAFVTVKHPTEVRANSLRLVFAALYFVGVSTAVRLLFRRAGK
jgi:hypothetical protein